MNLSDWKCVACGHCCKTVKSLMLSVDEAKLFPKHLLVPEIVSGDMTILYYQIVADVCPLYKDGCTIYENRPLICKCYPLMNGALAKCKHLDKSALKLGPATISPDLVKCQEYGQTLIEKLRQHKDWIRL